MKPDKLYHCTTPKKAQLYKNTGHIIYPVRGFDSLQAAMLWCIKTKRTVIYEIKVPDKEITHKLPDHHNDFGNAYWIEQNIKYEDIKCVLSV